MTDWKKNWRIGKYITSDTEEGAKLISELFGFPVPRTKLEDKKDTFKITKISVKDWKDVKIIEPTEL